MISSLTVQPAIGNDADDHRDRHGRASAPGRCSRPRWFPVGNGKLGLQIDRTVIKDRKDRIDFLKAHAGRPRVRRQARRPVPQADEEGAGRNPGARNSCW